MHMKAKVKFEEKMSYNESDLRDAKPGTSALLKSSLRSITSSEPSKSDENSMKYSEDFETGAYDSDLGATNPERDRYWAKMSKNERKRAEHRIIKKFIKIDNKNINYETKN